SGGWGYPRQRVRPRYFDLPGGSHPPLADSRPAAFVALQLALHLGGLGAKMEFPFRRPATASQVQDADARRLAAVLAQAERVNAGPLLTVQADGTVRAEAALIALALPPAADAQTRSGHGGFLSGLTALVRQDRRSGGVTRSASVRRPACSAPRRRRRVPPGMAAGPGAASPPVPASRAAAAG